MPVELKVQVQRQLMEKPASPWREDSAVWEIIAGEVILQRSHLLARNVPALGVLAARRAAEAARLAEGHDLNGAGHAMIGCTVALALAARTAGAAEPPIEDYASELAGAISWQASEPSPSELARFARELRRLEDPGELEGRPTIWELAVRAGAHAAGLSPHIVRRRQRRDLLGPAEQGDQ